MTEDQLWDALTLLITQAQGDSPSVSTVAGFWEEPELAKLLLQVANQTELGQRFTHAHPSIPEKKITESVLSLITQGLLACHEDPHKTLGIKALTPPDQIKEHHRLLIRLYHPDRTTLPPDTASTLAAKINHAFTILTSPPDQETTLSTQRRAQVERLKNQGIQQRLRRSERYRSLIPKIPPAFAMGASALLMLGVVAMAYHDNQQANIIGATAQDMHVEETSAAQLWSKKLARSGQQLLPTQATSARQESQPDQGADHLSDTTSTPIAVRRDQHPDPLQTSVNPVNPLPKRWAELASSNKMIDGKPDIPYPSQTDAKAPTQKMPTQNAEPSAAVEAANEDKHPPDSITQEQIRRLTLTFLGSYNQGDLEAFMRLFSDAVKVDGSYDKETLRSTYEKLFNTTSSREMIWKNPQWKVDQDNAVGRVEYSVKIKDHSITKTFNGTLDMQVKASAGHSVIMALFNHPES